MDHSLESRLPEAYSFNNHTPFLQKPCLPLSLFSLQGQLFPGRQSGQVSHSLAVGGIDGPITPGQNLQGA